MEDEAPRADSRVRLLIESGPISLAPTRSQRVASIIVALTLVLLGLWTLRGFLRALAWAVILAIATWPLYERAKKRCPASLHNIILPTTFTLAIALVLILPLVLFGVQLSHEARSFFSWADGARRNGIPPPPWVPQIPLFGSTIGDWWQANLAGPQRTASFLGRLNRSDLVAVSQNVGAQLVRRGVTFTFTILTLFFLFKEGERLSKSLLFAGSRLFGPRGQQVGRQIVASIHGTVDGLVMVGLGEGLILGIAYYFAGVPHATLFGAATAVAAIMPFGAPLLFSVVAIVLVLQGSTIAAAIVFALGLLIVAVADNLIRPVIIGSVTRLPFLWVLLGILGGVEAWGLLGLFLGPAIMAVLMLLWREWASPCDPSLPPSE